VAKIRRGEVIVNAGNSFAMALFRDGGTSIIECAVDRYGWFPVYGVAPATDFSSERR